MRERKNDKDKEITENSVNENKSNSNTNKINIVVDNSNNTEKMSD